LLTASLFLPWAVAQGAEPQPIPKALDVQVNRLVELFKDSEGTLHPGSVMTQTVDRADTGQLKVINDLNRVFSGCNGSCIANERLP
jgi:hypothetical protein